jgi:hypothetical protein
MQRFLCVRYGSRKERKERKKETAMNATSSETSHEPQPLACDLSAIPAAERAQHAAIVQQWRSRVRSTRELPGGVAYRFDPDAAILLTLAEFVARERLCCPFFRFQIELEPGGPLWLRLSGPDGTQDFIRDAFAAD